MELKKLVLNKETVKVLSDEALAKVGGGGDSRITACPTTNSCEGTCTTCYCTTGCASGNPPCPTYL